MSFRPVESLDESEKSGGSRCNSPDRWDVLRNVKTFVAILLLAAVPVYAQAQNPRVTTADAHKVVAIISGDKAKIQTYCEIQKLSEQIEQAYEKKDNEMADELSQKMDKLEETLGREYVALMDAIQDIDPEKDKLAAEITSAFEALDRLCTR
jgi:hypothetical protein